MTSINTQQALAKLEVVHGYNKIIDNPYNRNTSSKDEASRRAEKERLELYKIYDRMTPEEKTETEVEIEAILEKRNNQAGRLR